VKILIVGPAWVGDMVMAQTLFKVLRQQYPDCVIDVLAPDWSRPLLERMPEVRQALAMPLGHGQFQWSVRRELGRKLKAENYDQSMALPNSWKSALVPFFAKIPVRTGWRGEMRYGLLNDVRALDKEKYPLMIERFAALVFEKNEEMPGQLPYPALEVDSTNVSAALNKFSLNQDKPILALCPGAEFGEAKRWPSEHYAAVAEQKLKEGWQVWLFGSSKDRPVTDEIVAAVPEDLRSGCANLAGDTTLADAIDLLSCATAAVTNDSGLMHITAALGRPLVVVYGSSSPQFTPPLSEQVKILSLKLSCSPCFKRECPLVHLNCLKQLQPDLALSALVSLVTLEEKVQVS